MSQKFDGLNFAFPTFFKYNRRVEGIHLILYVVNEYFVGEFFINCGNQMEPLAVVGQEGSGSEVINLKVDRLEL